MVYNLLIAQTFDTIIIRKVEQKMEQITIVDARMGRGKSSAAIRYMNENQGRKRFLYITPFLVEVDRICEACDFEQPDSDYLTKSSELKWRMRAGQNVSATHSLFQLLDDEALEIARERHYSLIIDESIDVISKVNVSRNDFDIITRGMVDVNEQGKVRWKDPEYEGKFTGYKRMSDLGRLFVKDSSFINLLDPSALEAFDEVYMLTYLFDGQYQKAYLDFFHIPYRVVGVEQDSEGYKFSNLPDNPPPIDYRGLITIVDASRMNALGEGHYALAKGWYIRRGYDNPELKQLRNNMRNFFEHLSMSNKGQRLWTTYSEVFTRLIDKNTGRYRNDFLNLAAKGTNSYRDRTAAAYLVNLYADPTLKMFFGRGGCSVDEDQFSLSSMLQWIWRTAIRDDRPINLYIPSRRMRELLIGWIERVSEGGR